MNLGEFEHIVLLAILRLGEDAYAIPIREEIEERTGRSVARGALYTALERLETKRCLRSRMSDPLPERGGRSRRYFTVTPAGLCGNPGIQAEPAPALAGPRRQARVMTHRHLVPPRLAERLLAMALGDGEWSETILGDLHEEHAARAGASRSRAAFWYCRQACRLGATGIAARIRRKPARRASDAISHRCHLRRQETLSCEPSASNRVTPFAAF